MNEAWFFVGLFVFIIVVWIALGGPSRGLSLKFPTIDYRATATEVATTSATSASSTLALPRAPFGIGNSSIHLPDIYEGIGDGSGKASGNGNTSGVRSTEPLVAVPGVVFPAPSPYRGRVRINGSVVNASSSDSSTEYVRISVSDDRGAAIDITGWTLTSAATYTSVQIPRGSILPGSGVINTTSDIVLDPGDSAIITTGFSPIGGSFRENKCTGYLGSVQTFYPSLPAECPSAADELATYYGKNYIHDPSCIDYANSLSRCRLPSPSGTRKLSSSCQNFMDSYINYNGCVATHKNEPDFPGTTWRIYLNHGSHHPLWRDRHEVVELLDKNGRIVDAISY